MLNTQRYGIQWDPLNSKRSIKSKIFFVLIRFQSGCRICVTVAVGDYNNWNEKISRKMKQMVVGRSEKI